MKKLTLFGLSESFLIFCAAAAFSLLVNFLNRAMGIKQRTNKIQKDINDYQKEYKEAEKKNDTAAMDRLKKREPEVMKGMQEMMFLPFKSMILVIPLFAAVMWVLSSNFPNFVIDLPIAMHLNGNELLGLNILHTSTYGSRGMFILSSLICGMAIEAVANRVLKQ